MKQFFYTVIFVLTGAALYGQDQAVLEKGSVSFLSSRNVYAKFASTKGIEIGDTLLVRQNNELLPALVVRNKSSTSTVCEPLLAESMQVGDEVFARTPVKKEPKKAEEKKTENPAVNPAPEAERMNTAKVDPVIVPPDEDEPLFEEKINGRISASSYSNFSDYGETHRMRYAFSFRGNNLKNSRFSTDNYITFRHTLDEWEEVRQNLAQALKVYALSVKYDFDSTSNLTLGRKINPKISSIGALDGLQFEKGLGNFIVGAIAGSRPDYSDYGLNPDLLQFGAYAGYVSANPAKYRQTTFGFIEQRNKAKIDRRFVYFQHSGELMKDLNLFGSFELDLFENIREETRNTLRFTNLYLSLRYRLSRNWRFSLSYDNRKNIIYYESYKSFIDQLIEDETRQGLRFGLNFRPFRFVTWGVNTSWRFQKSDMNVSKNLNSYLNFSRIPVVELRASVTANFLQTNYLNSRILGIRLSREIVKGKLDGDLYYRRVHYNYKISDNAVQQNIAGASLSYRLLKHLSLYLYYEGAFDDRQQSFHRFNSKLIRRF